MYAGDNIVPQCSVFLCGKIRYQEHLSGRDAVTASRTELSITLTNSSLLDKITYLLRYLPLKILSRELLGAEAYGSL